MFNHIFHHIYKVLCMVVQLSYRSNVQSISYSPYIHILWAPYMPQMYLVALSSMARKYFLACSVPIHLDLEGLQLDYCIFLLNFQSTVASFAIFSRQLFSHNLKKNSWSHQSSYEIKLVNQLFENSMVSQFHELVCIFCLQFFQIQSIAQIDLTQKGLM